MLGFSKLIFNLLVILFLPAIALFSSENPNGYWFDRADLPTARQEILPGGLDGKVYVIGGWLDGSSITDLVEVYDPATDTWSTAAPLPYPLHHCALASVDGILYVIGGYYNISWPWYGVNDVIAYDPNTDEWTYRSPMSVKRGEHSAVVYQGKIYVTGGNDYYGNATPVVEIYDPAADTWSLADSLPTVRHHHASAVVDSLIYVVGGRQGYWGGPYTSISTVEAYSPASDTWYTVTDMPKPRGGLSATGIDGKLYIFGGEIPGLFSEVEEYDPGEDSWRELTPMLTPRHGTAAVIIEDTVYIIGGGRAAGILPDNSTQGFVLGTCTDSDNDGYADTDDTANTCLLDNCPDIYNSDQNDSDNDYVGDVCDNCPDSVNTNQQNSDNDSLGDACDNCPFVDNEDQADADGDGIGDVCEFICGDANNDEAVNIFDITFIITHLYLSGPPPDPVEAADVNNDSTVNIFDITFLISYLYTEGPEPNCA